jgi:hypothetical protein
MLVELTLNSDAFSPKLMFYLSNAIYNQNYFITKYYLLVSYFLFEHQLKLLHLAHKN